MKFDQFFLKDSEVIKEMVSVAKINKNDVVLEIGPGKGVLTRQLIGRAKKIIAVEIDRKFEPDLKNLAGVQMVFGDALKFIKTKKVKFNKIISSLPSSLVEPLFKLLPNVSFENASFLVPLIFLKKMKSDLVINTFFDIEYFKKVDKNCFKPQPKTNWGLIGMTKKEDVLKNKGYEDFLIQYLYRHPKAKLKNTFMDAVIEIYAAQRKEITKNYSRGIIGSIDFEGIDLDKPAVLNKNLGGKIKLLAKIINNM